MPPRPESSSATARLRRATTRAASSSDNAPATHAAAISPWECPTTAEGATPWARHSSASDTIIAHSAGWTTSTRSSAAASSSTSSRFQSAHGDRAAAHSRIRWANTGDVVMSSRPMPAHCAPWPGKTNTTPFG